MTWSGWNSSKATNGKSKISITCAGVFNLSLKLGVVPFEWKEANIIPLFKKGSRNKSDNYRQESITSVICKLLDRLIKYFLVRNKLLKIIKSISTWIPKSEVMLNKYIYFFLNKSLSG